MRMRVLLVAGLVLVLSAVAVGSVGLSRAVGMRGTLGFTNGHGAGPMGRIGPGGIFTGAMGPGGVMNSTGAGGVFAGATGHGGGMGRTGLGASGGVVGPGGLMGGYSAQLPASGQAISIDQAQQDVEQYLASNGNSDLKLNELVQFQDNFYAGITEKSTGVVAFALLVNPVTGAVGPEAGPNMMWNTKYGMSAGGMFGARDSSATMSVSSQQAQQIAQKWLDANLPGASANAPDRSYGFYTVDFDKGGQLSGMLSVNGSTGAVWYHTWHGAFIQEKRLAS